MYHLHMFFHLFKKVAAKSQCFALLGQMHNLGLGKGLWKESMHFFPTCLNCSERWYHLSKMEDGQDFPRKGLNCKFQGNTSLDDAIRECNSSFSTMSHLLLSNELPLSQMDSAYTGLNYLSYWNEKTSFWIGNNLFLQMQYHSPSRQYSFIQMRNLSLINDKPFFIHWPAAWKQYLKAT